MSEDSYGTTTSLEPLSKVSLRMCTKYYINITSYLISTKCTILIIEDFSDTVHSPFLKQLTDLRVSVVSIYKWLVEAFDEALVCSASSGKISGEARPQSSFSLATSAAESSSN